MVHESRHHGSAARSPGQSPTMASSGRPESRAAVVLSSMNQDIKALNSSLLVLSQKINYIVSLMMKNMILLKKIKDLEQGKAAPSGEAIDSKELMQLKELAEQNSAQVSELYSAVERLRENSVKEEQFKELKYVIDSINPLEFVTYKDIDRLIDEKSGSQKKPKK